MKRNFYIGAIFLALVAALAAGSVMLEKKTTAEGAEVLAPRFEVDPLWPKPLPNHWVQGMSVGVSVDPRDHVWIVHRTNTFEPMEIYASAQPPKAECCVPAPPVLEFDEEGNLIGHWGGKGQGYDWPDSNHGITVDHQGNVWLAGNGAKDTQILKFDGAGKFLFQIGKHGVHNGSNDTENFWQPTKIWEDVMANEVYIGDGYGNRRVIVLDVQTGKYKRHW